MRRSSGSGLALRPFAAVLAVLLACGPPGDRAEDRRIDRQTAELTAEVTAKGSDPATETGAPDGGERGWRTGTAAPLALTEVAAAPFAGAAWTAGGLDADGRAVSAVQIYDPTFDVWTEGPGLPEAVHHSALVSAGDRLYLLGGFTGPTLDVPTGEVAVLDAATGRWEPAPSLPQARAAGAAAWDGERVVYAGGVGPHGPVDDVWALGAQGWSRIGELSQPREHLAAASDVAGTVWFLGGRTGTLESNVAVVDLVRGQKVTGIGALPTARGGLTAFFGGPDLGACAAGGEGPDGTFAAVECIDADGTVDVLPDLAVARHGAGAAVVEGSSLIMLGGPEPGLTTSAVVELLRLVPADDA